MCDIDGVPFDERCFKSHFLSDWNAGQTLAELFEKLKAHAQSGQPIIPPELHWDLKGPMDEETQHHSAWWCRFTGPDGKQVRLA